MAPSKSPSHPSRTGTFAPSDPDIQARVTRLRSLVPRCACCDKSLLASMRSQCAECGLTVCRRDAACQQAHSRTHLQDYFDKRAQALSQRGRITKPGKGDQ